MPFKLGTSNEHQVRHKMTPAVLLPWQQFCFPVFTFPVFVLIKYCSPVMRWIREVKVIWAPHVFQVRPSVTLHLFKIGDI